MKKEIVVALTLLIAFAPISNAKVIYLSCQLEANKSSDGTEVKEDALNFIIDLDNKIVKETKLKYGDKLMRFTRVNIEESKIEADFDFPDMPGTGIEYIIDRRTLELKTTFTRFDGQTLSMIGICDISKEEEGKKIKNKF